MSCREVLAGSHLLGWEGGSGIAFAPVAGRLDAFFWTVWPLFWDLGKDGYPFFAQFRRLVLPSLLPTGLLGGDGILGWTGSNKLFGCGLMQLVEMVLPT